MRPLALSLVAFALAGCDNSQTDQYQQAIAGRWVGEISDERGVRRPSELEFTRVTSKDTNRTLSYNGRVKASIVTKEPTANQGGEMKTAEGKYLIEGKKLTITLQNFGKQIVHEYTITELDDDFLVLVNEKKEEMVYRKKN